MNGVAGRDSAQRFPRRGSVVLVLLCFLGQQNDLQVQSIHQFEQSVSRRVAAAAFDATYVCLLDPCLLGLFLWCDVMMPEYQPEWVCTAISQRVHASF